MLIRLYSCLCVGVKRKNFPVIFHSASQSARQTYCQLHIIKTTLINSWDRWETAKRSSACLCISAITTLTNLLHFDTKPYHNPSPPPFGFVIEMSLVFFVSRGGGNVWYEGLGGRLATGRHLSPRLASAHCCQPFSNQQPSMCLAAEGVSNQLLTPELKTLSPITL